MKLAIAAALLVVACAGIVAGPAIYAYRANQR